MSLAAENDERLPLIEPWPSHPAYAADNNAQAIAETSRPYGLQGPVLVRGSDARGPKFHVSEGSSYQRHPMAGGRNLTAVRLKMGGLHAEIENYKLMLAFDYEAVRDRRSNALFADGDIEGISGE